MEKLQELKVDDDDLSHADQVKKYVTDPINAILSLEVGDGLGEFQFEKGGSKLIFYSKVVEVLQFFIDRPKTGTWVPTTVAGVLTWAEKGTCGGA